MIGWLPHSALIWSRENLNSQNKKFLRLLKFIQITELKSSRGRLRERKKYSRKGVEITVIQHKLSIVLTSKERPLIRCVLGKSAQLNVDSEKFYMITTNFVHLKF